MTAAHSALLPAFRAWTTAKAKELRGECVLSARLEVRE